MKRSWMALVAATASLAVAAGCGGGGGSDNAGSGGGVKPVAKIGPTEGALNLIAWQGYTEPNVVKPFEAQTGCQVHVTYGQTSDDMVRLMRTGNFDGVSASGDATNRLIAAGDVKPVDVQKLIPDFKDISPGAPVAAAQHGGRPALRRLLRVGRRRADVQQEGRHHSARQLGRHLRRHELLRQGRRLRQPDLHRRRGRVPEVGAARPQDHRPVRADAGPVRRRGEPAEEAAPADRQLLGQLHVADLRLQERVDRDRPDVALPVQRACRRQAGHGRRAPQGGGDRLGRHLDAVVPGRASRTAC